MESFDAYAVDSDGYTGFDSFRMAADDDRVYSEDHHFTAAVADEPKELGEEDEVESYSNGYGHHQDDHGHHVEAPPPYQSAFDDDDALSSAMSFDANRPHDFAPSEDFSPSMGSNGKGFGLLHDVEDVVYGFPQSSAGSFNGGAGLPPPEELDGMFGFPPQSGSFDGGAVLPPPAEEMQAEEGFLLREWRRMNAIRLEEKSRAEREQLSQIIDEADAFKDKFYEKRRTHCDITQKNNREKEKVFLENMEKFHATADTHYWKAVAELVPNEMPSKEVKSRGNKDKKKPTVVFNQGPKPGKATDLTRMRQVLLKLKHNPPAHMKPPPPPPPPPPPAAPAPGTEAPDARAAASATTTPPQAQARIQAVAGA